MDVKNNGDLGLYSGLDYSSSEEEDNLTKEIKKIDEEIKKCEEEHKIAYEKVGELGAKIMKLRERKRHCEYLLK